MKIIVEKNSIVWAGVQQFAVRAIVAAKFFICARLLGPSDFGLIGMALLIIGALEAISDVGVNQSIIQKKRDLTDEENGALLSVQIIRGCLISLIVYLTANLLASYFNEARLVDILNYVAIILIIRGFISPAYASKSRDLNFRFTSVVEMAVCAVDLIVTLVCINYYNLGAISMIVGISAGDSIKLTVSWLITKNKIRPNLNFGIIQESIDYGKWVWLSNILIFMLNSADKFLVAKIFGSAEMGVYQMVSKISQLCVSDVVGAATQYLFPRLSKSYRDDDFGRDTRKIFEKFLKIITIFILTASMVVVMFSSSISELILKSEDWGNVSEILKYSLAQMYFGSIVALFSTYYRAIGQPKMVTVGVFIQLFFMICVMVPLINILGVKGAILANIIAILSVLLYMGGNYIKDKGKK